MTPEEIREFHEGNVTLVEMAPAGVERAMCLPYELTIDPGSISVGKSNLSLQFLVLNSK